MSWENGSLGSRTDDLLALFDQQVAQQADRVAVRGDSYELTYRQLDEQSNRLAHWLRDQGVTDDVVVAICQRRGWPMVVSVLAILKAGGAYLPLDPHYPAERLAFMLSDSGAAVLLTDASLADQFPEFRGPRLLVDRDWQEVEAQDATRLELASRDDRLAYVIYTSGSTGTPKGVAMGRAALANLIVWQRTSSRATIGTRTLQYTPLSFDVHFQELFGTWSTGGTLVLVDDEVRLDPLQLLAFIERQQIERLFLPFVALAQLAEVATSHRRWPHSLREIITAGEQLKITSPIVTLFEQLSSCTLHNHYGPSETHVVTSHVLEGDPRAWPALPPIGRPIDGVTIHLWDAARQPVAEGAAGEIYVSGIALARGYLDRPELTRERFVEHNGERLYRTGDLAERLPDGTLKFLGRADGQVKLRGYRIELGEIEVALGLLPDVQAAAATVYEQGESEKRLVGYVVGPAREAVDLHAWREQLGQRLPEYMVPTHFVCLAALPLTPSGKVDRSKLPAPSTQRPELAQPFVAPDSELEQYLCQLWCELLQLDRVGTHDNFFELGGTSLLAMRCVSQLQLDRGESLPVTALFEQPTVAGLAARLSQAGKGQIVEPSDGGRERGRRGAETSPIAIIGLAGMFPGAADVDQFWQNLCAGRDSISFFAADEIDPNVPAEVAGDRHYVPARGILPRGAEWFDAPFFGITPGEAEILDPQQRVFLETAWQALERAGYVPESFGGKIGVYAGAHNNTYFPHHLQTRPDVIDKRGAFQVMVANEKDYLATRVAHKLNLTGPALSINTACSTSLVAVAEACSSLDEHACDLALAGGVAVTFPQRSGYRHQPGGMLSPDGHCRPFDADAQGTTFNDGVGVVVLKRLDDAVRDGDHIHAVIPGWAVNNDGGQKASFSAPSVAGQAEVIAMAQDKAGVSADSISYVEAHGTATPLGDPIEVEALTRAFRAQTDRVGFCALGSVKGNIGHLTAAAGVAGLIKTALALEHKTLPPTAHFRQENPQIPFADSPFYVNREPLDWPAGELPRRAGVSSFGVGGTNAHVILEESPSVAPPESSVAGTQLLTLSARSESALHAAAEGLAAYLEEHPGVSLSDVSHTLDVGRRSFAERGFVVVDSVADAVEALRTRDAKRWFKAKADAEPRRLALLFPGQGAQYARMGEDLYRGDELFRRSMDACAEKLLPWLGCDLREVLYPADRDDEAAGERLRQTMYTQPALFAVEYALAQSWLARGLVPTALVGHSIGEFVAACLAGVFSLDDALRLVATRGAVMQRTPPGAMLSIRQSAAWLEPRRSDQLALAAINAPSLCVAAGPCDAIDALAVQLEGEGVACKRLHTSHAFHSPLVDEAVDEFVQTVSEVELHAPQIPIVSTATGTWLTDGEATDPWYWARHLRRTVQFAPAVATLCEDSRRVLLEVGPRATLITLARQNTAIARRPVAIASLGDSASDGAECRSILEAAGRLWLAGVSCSWQSSSQSGRARRIPLPTYPFERRPYLVEPGRQADRATNASPPNLTHSSVDDSPSRIEQMVPLPTSEVSMSPIAAERLMPQLLDVFADLSGFELSDLDPATSFLELGMDSLMLTQAATELQKQFGVEISFRQLIEQYCSPALVAEYLATQLPDEEPAVATQSTAVQASAERPVAEPQTFVARPAMQESLTHIATGVSQTVPSSEVALLVSEQLRVMSQQLALLGGTASASSLGRSAVASSEPTAEPTGSVSTPAPSKAEAAQESAAEVESDQPKPFGAAARISLQQEQFDAGRQQALDSLTERYVARTLRSKQLTEQNRGRLADPRVVSGFRPQLKELIYPIVVERSQGSKLWDIDGNEYIDLTCGFGSNFLGNSAPCIVEAVREQLERGYEIGPQHPLAGEVAEMITRLTGLPRVAFCNTGSEAVLGAMRIARTVTGRDTIVMFNGAYHGIVDEVIVRSAANGRSLPAAAGIPRSAVQNVLLVDYGTDEALEILRGRAHEIAGVLVEPVQSRRPDLQPREFLHQLRSLTSDAGAALIFDEVITGFRIGPGGAQAEFGVRADVATYGKVVGGGMPIGVIAGQGRFMDALDGGAWRFGDASSPQAGVTYFAGTFVRHPLALAAARAVLQHIESQGPRLYEELNANTASLVGELNRIFEERGAPLHAAHFGSLFKCAYTESQPLGELLFTWLRLKGIHIWDARPCFLTTAHTSADLQRIVAAFRETVEEMQAAGFLPPPPAGVATPAQARTTRPTSTADAPPVEGARLGRDPLGNPAWYVSDPENPSQYVQVGAVV